MQGNYRSAEQDGHGARRLHARTCPGPRSTAARSSTWTAPAPRRRRRRSPPRLRFGSAEHWDAVSQYPEPWMRVEAVRAALFEAAREDHSEDGAGRNVREDRPGRAQGRRCAGGRAAGGRATSEAAAGGGVVVVARHGLSAAASASRQGATPRPRERDAHARIDADGAALAPRSRRRSTIPIWPPSEICRGGAQPVPRGGARPRQPVEAAAQLR